MLDLLVLIVVSLVISVLAAFVLTRNTANNTNRFYALFCFVTVAWSIFSYLANKNYSYTAQLTYNRLSFVTGLILIACVWLFSAFFPAKAGRLGLQSKIATIVLISGSLLAGLTSTVVESVKYNSERSVIEVQTGGLYYTYLIAILIFCILIAYNFRRVYISKKSNGLIRRQVVYVASGVLLSSVWVFVTTALIPSITNNWSISRLGFSGLLFFEFFTAFAIVRHKLFDIRLIVARSLGYVLTLATLVGVYAITVFGLSGRILGTGQLTGVQQALYIVATLIFGFSLTPLKRFFDKLTNRLFYRDAYDAQDLLDKLNKVLVGNIDLDSLLKQTADLIAITLKAEYAAFIIRETDGTARRASFSKIVKLDADQILHIITKKKGKTELFVTDELDPDHDKHKQVLADNNIAIAARMVASGASDKDQGYLLLGAKQSGNPYNKQDIQVLDIIANELVIAIQNALRFEEIETFNVTLQQKVDDATRQLRQTNEKLKAIDETKDEFISMASHQLRTPLTAVKGYVSMVVEGDAGKLNKQQKELLDQAFSSSQRMVYLIADLLNVSRLKSGKFVIENKPTQLAEVVASEMEQLTEVAKSKNQTLTYKKPDNFPMLMLDETKIRQVIMNFADNALHYTGNGGHIQINLEDTGESIQYTVVDDGLGVPKAEQHHLFTKFYRAGNAKKARPDGTGLGLFMAKKVIVAQGGAVIFKSEEGKGSTFGFTFPKKALAVAPNAAKKA